MAKKLFILAGPNGSGKSTLYRKLIGKYKTLLTLPFVNPDDIAKEIFGDFLPNGSNESNQKMLRAGKEAIKRRKQFLHDGISFGLETTFSGNSEKKLIDNAIEKGYDLYIVYIALSDPLLNVQRVRTRVQNKGHFVDPAVVVRRYHKSMQQIIEVAPKVKALYLFDNSQTNYKRIASLRKSGAREEQDILLNTPLPQWSKEIINNLINQKIPNDETAEVIEDARNAKHMTKIVSGKD
jgi:predicted ABC-type ATPase